MCSLILTAIFSVIFCNAQKIGDIKQASFIDRKKYDFQINLLSNTGVTTGQHLVVAPFSVWALMSVLAEGTRGETNKELRRSIGKKINRKYNHEVFANVTKFFRRESSVTVERASFLFHDSHVALYPDYVTNMTNYYDMHVEKIDVSKPHLAAKQINEHLRKATHGRIGPVVDPQDFTDARIILMETIYFKGSWTTAFDKSATVEQDFYNNAGDVIGRVNMMHKRMSLGFSNLEKLNSHVIELPYGSSHEFTMLVILPFHGVNVSEVYAGLRNMTLTNIFDRMARDKLLYGTEDVDVWIPRFKITTDAHLMKPLNMIGIKKIFTKEADFSRMTSEAMYVTDVIQKAEIEVTEEGTVASAVSYAVLANRISVPKFSADRPFIFAILEKSSETILFSGIYSKPSLF